VDFEAEVIAAKQCLLGLHLHLSAVADRLAQVGERDCADRLRDIQGHIMQAFAAAGAAGQAPLLPDSPEWNG
jgi:hypothetical protein